MSDLRHWELVGLSSVDAYGNVSSGGAQFLVEPAVGANPQVVLSDSHLENKWQTLISLRGYARAWSCDDVKLFMFGLLLHRGNLSQAWSPIPAAVW